MDAGLRPCRNVQLNKRHWNTVILDGTVADDEVREWIEHSYDLVVAKLPRQRREVLRAP
jgi:predicted DNA-binding protein (MmcQ/YjbR family)